MNSGTDFAGRSRVTTIMFGTRTMPATPSMSFRKLKGSLLYSVALIAFAGLTRNTV